MYNGDCRCVRQRQDCQTGYRICYCNRRKYPKLKLIPADDHDKQRRCRIHQEIIQPENVYVEFIIQNSPPGFHCTSCHIHYYTKCICFFLSKQQCGCWLIVLDFRQKKKRYQKHRFFHNFILYYFFVFLKNSGIFKSFCGTFASGLRIPINPFSVLLAPPFCKILPPCGRVVCGRAVVC